MLKNSLAVLLLMLMTVLAVDTPTERITHEFCWKDTYVRGVGKIPGKCAPNQERIGLLCYPNCPSGMYRWGFDCHSYCPSGWADQGLFCRLVEYGRGAGFPWKFGDPLNDSGMIRRCEAVHGKGQCQKWGAVYYPKCKQGYNNFGCCICRPKVPNCPDFNMNPGIDLSCAKKIIIGKPYTGQCEPDQEKDVGLCYKKCDTAYKGIGPVCWGKNPNNWVGCGMGSAVTTKVCVDIIMGQIFSVGQMALNVVTLGATATASSALGDIKKLKEQYENLVKLYEAASEMADIIIAAQKDPEYSEIVKDAEESKTTDPNKVMPEDLARIAASIAALVDPSGIAGTIAAFTYAKCSKIFGSYSAQDVEQIERYNTKEEGRRFEVELSHKAIEEQQKIMEKAISEGKGNPEWYAPLDEQPKTEL